MNFLTPFALPTAMLLYFANVAVAAMVVATATLLLERLFRRAALPLRHLLLVVGLVAVVASPAIVGVSIYSGRSLLQFNLDEPTTPPDLAHAVVNSPSENISGPDRAPVELSVPPQTLVTHNVSAAALATTTKVDDEPPSSTTVSLTDLLRPALPVVGTSLLLAWGVGCTVATWRLMRGVIGLRQLSLSLRPVDDTQLLALAQAAARTLRLPATPPLYKSTAIVSPLSVGPVRPCVVLPFDAASSFSRAQLRGLLLHEFAHIARGDHYVGLLQRLAAILFWWNLPLQRASGRLSEIREQICDDVSTVGDVADDYATMLVDMASRVASLSPLPATIGVLDGKTGEFTQRICRLLDPHRRIVTTLDRRAKLFAAGCFLLLIAPAAAPLDLRGAAFGNELAPIQTADNAEASPAPADERKSDELKDDVAEEQGDDESKTSAASPVEWPERLQGVILDSEGQPVAGAQVRLDFEKIHEYSSGRWDETLSSETQVTGSDGKYSFDSANFARLTHRPFLLMLTCTAPGYADAKWWCWYSRNDTEIQTDLTDVKLAPGRTVHGRCVDPAGAPVAGAIVKMANGYDSNRTASWAWDPRRTSSDGTFEFSVPREEVSYEIWAVHPQWAPQRVALPTGENDFGDVRLEEGAVIRGTVRNADGAPVAGTVVVAESVDSGGLKSVSFDVTVAAKTDAEGNYELQPLGGAYKVYLSAAAETDDRLDQPFVVADGTPPLVVPARLELSPGETVTHDIRSGSTLKVSGTVRWPDGRPVPQCETKASYLPSDNGTGIWIAQTLTDDQGRYTLELPNPIDDVSISVFGAFDANRVWHRAEPAESVEAKQKSAQSLVLHPLDGDVSDMDWVVSGAP